MATISPTRRTTIQLQKDPNVLMYDITEKWQAFGPRKNGGRGIRKDTFGIIDIIALDRIKGVRGIQSTGTAFAPHLKALLTEKREAAICWLSMPGTTLELWGWKKNSKGRYVMRFMEFKMSDFLIQDGPFAS